MLIVFPEDSLLNLLLLMTHLTNSKYYLLEIEWT